MRRERVGEYTWVYKGTEGHELDTLNNWEVIYLVLHSWLIGL